MMDPPSVDCNSSRDPPSAGEEFVQKRRQQARGNRKENSSKPYSTIRFSNNLEVYTKTASNQYTSVTPTRSILRTKTKGNQTSSKPSGRRKDSLLEKIQRLSQEQDDRGHSEKEEPHGPVRPRRDWNIESLFAPSNEKKLESRNLANRSRRVDPTGAIHTRTSNYEQYYSSEYLLKKYAEHSNGSPKANVDVFAPKLKVTVLPLPSPDSTNTSVSSTPTEREDRHRGPFSDSKVNDKSTTQKRFPATRIGRRTELSYLQLEENAAYDDPEFSINGGYNLANIIQRYPVDSPKSSIASYDQLLIQKSTSDTGCTDDEMPLEQKQFNWDGLYNDAPHYFDNGDFHHPDSKRSRTILKPWAVWFLVGTVCVCIASTLLVYLTMTNETGESSIYDDVKLDVDECTHHDHTSGRFVSDRYNTIRYHLLFQIGGNITMMDQPGSPQREALCWISEFDDYKIGVTDGNEAAIVQRYSLAVIYFSTVKERGKSRDDSVIKTNFNFLSALHECDWDGIICNHSRDVTILRISNKSLFGKIPPEIGNLISLSAYNKRLWSRNLVILYPNISVLTFLCSQIYFQILLI